MISLKRFRPSIVTLLFILASTFFITPHVSGQGARTEEILRNIISGGKVPQEAPAAEQGESQSKKETVHAGKDAADRDLSAAQPKRKSDRKGAGSADEALYNTGVDFYNSQLYEAAVKSFGELKSKHPQSQRLHSAMIYSGKAHMRLREYGKALDDLSAVPAESGEYQASLFQQGEAKLGLGNRTEAITLFYRVATQFPQLPLADDALIRASQVFLEERKGRQALDAAVKVIRYYGDRETVDDAYFMIGQVYEKDPEVRDVEVSRKVYRVFIRKAEAHEKYFDGSPLLRRVKRELKALENRYFRYEK